MCSPLRRLCRPLEPIKSKTGARIKGLPISAASRRLEMPILWHDVESRGAPQRVPQPFGIRFRRALDHSVRGVPLESAWPPKPQTVCMTRVACVATVAKTIILDNTLTTTPNRRATAHSTAPAFCGPTQFSRPSRRWDRDVKEVRGSAVRPPLDESSDKVAIVLSRLDRIVGVAGATHNRGDHRTRADGSAAIHSVLLHFGRGAGRPVQIDMMFLARRGGRFVRHRSSVGSTRNAWYVGTLLWCLGPCLARRGLSLAAGRGRSLPILAAYLERNGENRQGNPRPYPDGAD